MEFCGVADADGEAGEAYECDVGGKGRFFTVSREKCAALGHGDGAERNNAEPSAIGKAHRMCASGWRECRQRVRRTRPTGTCDIDPADLEAFSLCCSNSGSADDGPIKAIARLDSNDNADINNAGMPVFAAAVTGPKFGLFADGVVDQDDYGVPADPWYNSAPTTLAMRKMADISPVSDYYFTGRQLDLVPHRATDLQRYHYRTRTHRTARFLQRDRRIYSDGTNANEYLRSRPMNPIDALGLQTAASGAPSEKQPSDWIRKVTSLDTRKLIDPRSICCKGTNTMRNPSGERVTL